MPETNRLDQVRPSAVRYIKLGPSGVWFERCIREGLVEFGHSAVPHQAALRRDRAELEEILAGQGRTPGKAKDFGQTGVHLCGSETRAGIPAFSPAKTALWVR
jgi:hypothetical protein